MNSNDHPDLTAFALGELDAEHSEAMAQWIAENPKAGAEADATTTLGERLRHAAPSANLRLHPQQRAAILNGPQRVRQLVAAASQSSKRRPSTLRTIIAGIGRMAAAAALIIGGFLAGTHFANRNATALASAKPAPSPSKTPAPSTGTITPFRAKEIVPPAIADTTPAPAAPVVVVKTAPAPATQPAGPAPIIVAKAPPMITKDAAKPVMPQTRVLNEPFVSTSKVTLAHASLLPAETRYISPKSDAPAAAAAQVSVASKPIEPVARTKQPELRIHSWKAEVASCPWDETHRLVRLTLQIPSEQESPTTRYPVQVTFDPNYVRNFRQLSQRTIAASAATAPAFHILWYEFTPNGQATNATREAKMIGSVTIPNALFTTPAAGPFDSTRLQIVDRGTAWTAAREDFLFETAVAGFGLLLKGENHSPALNHSLVLKLAQHAAIDDDRTGERAKFIKLVEDARQMAGL